MRHTCLQLLSVLTLLLISAAQANSETALSQEIQTALTAKQGHYQVRTQHLCALKPCYTNHLILENSPYLLQHAHNPIAWQAWTQAALDLARRQNKPIFLSIGYAACHWCHVMEEESFDDLQVAELINRHFIPIKVDREQRPDIDEFYANAVMYFQGTQGWPMSVFLTPDGKAFFGGGYYPKQEFIALLERLQVQWNTDQAQTIKTAQATLDAIQGMNKVGRDASALDDAIRINALAKIRSIHDLFLGGFGEGSKFPREPWLLLLLDDSSNNPAADNSYTALTNTLTHIARGGLRDHLGGGFHRYTTDPAWKTPHFEKMLYTQALLANLYLQTSRLEPHQEFTEVARETLEFMRDALQAPGGGFYASLDADTAEGEGYYYVWNLQQWNAALSADEAAFARDYYDMDEYGEMGSGQNVLRTPTALAEFTESAGLSLQDASKLLKSSREKLLRARAQRTAPALDKKIIMSWNSMAIEAFATASTVLNNPRYHEVAAHTADFIWDTLRDGQQFQRIFIQGHREQAAQLDDYAWYLRALISLYDADENPKWLSRAESVAAWMQADFLDEKHGGLFQTAHSEDATLPIRPKTAYDKTLPAANAIAAQALIKLFQRSGNHSYKQLAENILAAFSTNILETPTAHSGLLIARHALEQSGGALPVYAAKGNIRIDAKLSADTAAHYKLEISLKMGDGWHINSNTPLDANLIATQIRLDPASDWDMRSINYPQPQTVTLGFSKKPLALYQGTSIVHANLKRNKTAKNPVIKLTLQACNEKICLPPEQLHFIADTR